MALAAERLTTRDMTMNPHEETGLTQDENARIVPHRKAGFP
jgi:hypothetical protein